MEELKKIIEDMLHRLTQTEEELRLLKKIVEDMRALIKENMLPRHAQTEEELRLLRKYTWPVCQSLAEESALGDMRDKREFLQQGTRDKEEAYMLLTRKWELSKKPVAFSSSATIIEELRRINF